MNGYLFFFLGTEAELIKVFPIMLECKKRNIPYYTIASGQNDLLQSAIWDTFDCGSVDLEVNHVRHITTGVQLMTWWGRTLLCAKRRVKKAFTDVDFRKSVMVVHGDTVSTFLGAIVGRRLKMRVAHVEAGLRSHNIFDPFPEEIDRMLTSKRARIHFAPGSQAVENLTMSKVKGSIVDTKHNTLFDSLQLSISVPLENERVKEIVDRKYFVFVMHRQENLMKEEFVREIVNRVAAASSEEVKCVILLHAITRNVFAKLGILELLRCNPNIILLPRTAYSDFMKLLNEAEFVITDGGSNQEELYYMGKPCLIIRNRSERAEGLGENASLYGGDYEEITRFINRHKGVQFDRISISDSPSAIIVDSLEKELYDSEC